MPHRLPRPLLPLGLALSLAFLLSPRPVAAHALVVESNPASGGVVAAASPGPAALRFNSRIDHARSRLAVVAADGTEWRLPLDGDVAPTVLSAPLPPLSPGAWRLRWQVLAVDGHITRGDVPFAAH